MARDRLHTYQFTIPLPVLSQVVAGYGRPAGAYDADKTLEGKANFGFVAKYKKGKTAIPEVDGNTEFQFKAGNLNFKSTFHEAGSLVISGGKATYRGEGTINGQGSYKFTLVAFDGDWSDGH